MIIGLDLSPNATGVCLLGGGGELVYWETISPPPVLNVQRRIQYTAGYLKTLCQVFSPEHAAIEDYAHAAHARGEASIREQGGVVRHMLLELGVGLYLYNISTIKKFATGDGGADKERMDVEFRKATRKRKDITEHVVDAFFVASIHFANNQAITSGGVQFTCTKIY